MWDFSKNLIYRTPPDVCADSSAPTNVLCNDHAFFVFSIHFFLLLVITAIIRIYSVCYFFPIIYQNINVNVVKTICLGNNLATNIGENTNFPRQRPWQLPSAEANFEGWLSMFLSHMGSCKYLWSEYMEFGDNEKVQKMANYKELINHIIKFSFTWLSYWVDLFLLYHWEVLQCI